VGEAKSHIVEVVTRVADAYPDWPDVQALKKELAPHAA
jgi:hypothetical protein